MTGSGGLIVVYAIIALAVSPVGEGPEEMERAIETGVSIGQVGFPLVWIAACAIGWHVYRRAKEKVDDGG
ncbi:hypothetical protein [Sulfidibacter corallicola]|uniref:Uncharacterized protein n=1 Tax=Sulfidibacter corallicola TaxID=2818388 RepID=A0A8A4TGX3_SULCO|nr:hypothetical protein [Sulfidibacter corallicola]QTD48883.1 hypothetical protein J3U87_25145 [Sulfidibacter corallicola]